jgi:hypothetical protein
MYRTAGDLCSRAQGAGKSSDSRTAPTLSFLGRGETASGFIFLFLGCGLVWTN